MRKYLMWVGLCGVVGVALTLAGCGGKETPEPSSADGSQQSNDSDSAAAAPTNGNAATPSPTGDPEKPVVRLETNMGTIVLELDRARAPKTVDAFKQFVHMGHYDGTIFHQIRKDTAILGGGFKPDRQPKMTMGTIENEADNGLKNERYTIAMYRQADYKDSAQSLFFINVADNPQFDHVDETDSGFGYCVFGRVIEGQGVVDKIAAVPVEDTVDFFPTQIVTIESATLGP